MAVVGRYFLNAAIDATLLQIILELRAASTPNVVGKTCLHLLVLAHILHVFAVIMVVLMIFTYDLDHLLRHGSWCVLICGIRRRCPLSLGQLFILS